MKPKPLQDTKEDLFRRLLSSVGEARLPRSVDMDVRAQHERFRSLVRRVVEERRRNYPNQSESDWLIKCHDSLSSFQELFPDREACEMWIEEHEIERRATERQIAETLDRVLNDGFSYQDIESLRYDFPAPDPLDELMR